MQAKLSKSSKPTQTFTPEQLAESAESRADAIMLELDAKLNTLGKLTAVNAEHPSPKKERAIARLLVEIDFLAGAYDAVLGEYFEALDAVPLS